jgi:hypothetical protein
MSAMESTENLGSERSDSRESQDVLTRAQDLVDYVAELELRLEETERKLGDHARAHTATKHQLDEVLEEKAMLEEALQAERESSLFLEMRVEPADANTLDLHALQARLDEESRAHSATRASLEDALLRSTGPGVTALDDPRTAASSDFADDARRGGQCACRDKAVLTGCFATA